MAEESVFPEGKAVPKSRLPRAKATKAKQSKVNPEPPMEDMKGRGPGASAVQQQLAGAGGRRNKRSNKMEVLEKEMSRLDVKGEAAITSVTDGGGRRPLSVIDGNRGGSRSSIGDLDDSVFAEAKTRLGSVVSSLEKHRRKLSGGVSGENPKVKKSFLSGGSPGPAPPSSAIVVNGPPPVAAHFQHDLEATSVVPEGVVDIDLEEDGMVEYGVDINAYLRSRELKFLVEPSYLEQNSVSADMRAVLVDWILQVQHYLKLAQQTLYIGISLLDTILDQRDVEPGKLQLVGITSLYVASKMEEYYPADMKKLLHLTENSFTAKEVFDMELVILGVVNFQVYVPTPVDFLPRFCRAALRSKSNNFQKTCLYLTDVYLSCPVQPTIPPSHIAAGAVFAANLLFYTQANSGIIETGIEHLWTPTLHYYTGYLGLEVLSTVTAMLSQLSETKLSGALNKYTSKSRHGQLALQPHLSTEVVAEALTYLGAIEANLHQVEASLSL